MKWSWYFLVGLGLAGAVQADMPAENYFYVATDRFEQAAGTLGVTNAQRLCTAFQDCLTGVVENARALANQPEGYTYVGHSGALLALLREQLREPLVSGAEAQAAAFCRALNENNAVCGYLHARDGGAFFCQFELLSDPAAGVWDLRINCCLEGQNLRITTFRTEIQ